MFYSGSTRAFYSPAIHGNDMPSDVVQITQEQYEQLLAAQTEGKQIVPDSDGRPMAIEPTLDPQAIIRAQIVALESQVTQRRLREAVLGLDNGWLADIDGQIAALRQQLTA